MTSKLRIIVTGLVGLYPVGGVAWDYLQYLIGLARLGHDVYYYEDTWSWPYQPVDKTYTADGRYSAQYIDDFIQRYAPQLSERWLYLHLHEQAFGMSASAFDEIARSADLFLNISGSCIIPESLSARCVKVFVDTAAVMEKPLAEAAGLGWQVLPEEVTETPLADEANAGGILFPRGDKLLPLGDGAHAVAIHLHGHRVSRVCDQQRARLARADLHDLFDDAAPL